MKHLTLLATLFFLSTTTNAQSAGEMIYLGKNEVLYNGFALKSPKQIRPLIEEKNDEALTKIFKKYKRKHRTRQIFGGFTKTVGPSTAISEFDGTGRQINYWIFPVVAATTGGEILLRKPFQRALKALVEEYNDLILLEKLQVERELKTAKN